MRRMNHNKRGITLYILFTNSLILLPHIRYHQRCHWFSPSVALDAADSHYARLMLLLLPLLFSLLYDYGFLLRICVALP